MPAIVTGRHIEWTNTFIGARSWQRIGHDRDCRLTIRERHRRLWRLPLPAVRTRLAPDIPLILLVSYGQWMLAGKTLGGLGFSEARIEGHPLIKHKTLALVVVPTTLLKVLKDAAFELIDLTEPDLLHIGPRLLTADTTGAEHHDRLLFEFFWQRCDSRRKIPEMIDADGPGLRKRAKGNLIVIAGIEERYGPPLIKPFLQFDRRQLSRWCRPWVDSLNTKGNDLFLQLH